MRFLLDTHVFLWFVNGDIRISKGIRSKILNSSEVYVSSASIWECAIKIKINKLNADINQLIQSIEESGFIDLPITLNHAAYVSKLPEIHCDPFDRMLIAQAISEPLIFLTADEQLKRYSDLVEFIGL